MRRVLLGVCLAVAVVGSPAVGEAKVKVAGGSGEATRMSVFNGGTSHGCPQFELTNADGGTPGRGAISVLGRVAQPSFWFAIRVPDARCTAVGTAQFGAVWGVSLNDLNAVACLDNFVNDLAFKAASGVVSVSGRVVCHDYNTASQKYQALTLNAVLVQQGAKYKAVSVVLR